MNFYFDNLPRKKAIAMLFDAMILGDYLVAHEESIRNRRYIAVARSPNNKPAMRFRNVAGSLEYIFWVKFELNVRWQRILVGGQRVSSYSITIVDHGDVADFIADKQCFVKRRRE